MNRDDEAELFKVHKGKPFFATFIGGEWHGERKRLRRPLVDTLNVAKPPRYLGNNFYDQNVGNLEYDDYRLERLGDELFYVHKDWLSEWPANKDKPYETRNQRLMREEKERQGGPRDLVEEGVIGHSPEVLEKFSLPDKIGRAGTEASEYEVGDSYPKYVTEDDLVRKDFEIYGVAFIVNGKRVDPRHVKMMVKTKNPLMIPFKDLIDS